MPKKKLTPEEQEQAFNDFNSSKECKTLVSKDIKHWAPRIFIFFIFYQFTRFVI